MLGISVSGEGATSGLSTTLGFIAIGVFALIVLVVLFYRRFILRNRVRVRIIHPNNKIKTHLVKDAQDTWELEECTYVIDNKKFVNDRWGRIIYFYYNNPIACTFIYQAEKHYIKVTKKNKQGDVIKEDQREIDGRILKGIMTTKLIQKLYQEGEMSQIEKLLLILAGASAIIGLFVAWNIYQGVSVTPESAKLIGEACKVALTGG